MRLTVLLALLMSLSSPAFAQDAAQAPNPVLGQLLKKPAYFDAWQSMISSGVMPDWITEYTATLEGPPVPSIPVTIDNQTYSLGFTCKPNECEENQLFVLFAPGGTQAWALLGSPQVGITWLGFPDDKIQAAITSALRQ